ncbi:hypothetical protein Bca4012_073067 [Brassica carinata]
MLMYTKNPQWSHDDQTRPRQSWSWWYGEPKDKDDRISLLETQMAAQQAGYEAQRRLNQQMMEMMQRMYPNEVFPDVPDP